MLLVITYDVNTTSPSGKKRLQRIAKKCVEYGQRVQNSVFECNVNHAQAVELKGALLRLFDDEVDSLRFYNLGNNYSSRIEEYGCKHAMDLEQPLVL